LVVQKTAAFPISHPIHILNYECLWSDYSQDPVELSVQEIYRVIPISFSALAIALARVTAYLEVGRWEFLNISDITGLDSGIGDVVLVGLARDVRDIVCPENIVAAMLQRQI